MRGGPPSGSPGVRSHFGSSRSLLSVLGLSNDLATTSHPCQAQSGCHRPARGLCVIAGPARSLCVLAGTHPGCASGSLTGDVRGQKPNWKRHVWQGVPRPSQEVRSNGCDQDSHLLKRSRHDCVVPLLDSFGVCPCDRELAQASPLRGHRLPFVGSMRGFYATAGHVGSGRCSIEVAP